MSPDHHPEYLNIARQAETEFQDVMRAALKLNSDGQIAECWRQLAEAYKQTLTHLPPEVPYALASRLGLLAERARRLSLPRS